MVAVPEAADGSLGGYHVAALTHDSRRRCRNGALTSPNRFRMDLVKCFDDQGGENAYRRTNRPGLS